VGGAENNQQLTDLFIAANRSARMYDLYLDYFEQWASMGGTVFCQFSSLCQPSKWGSWCALETINQDTAASPKYRALKEMIRRYPPPSMQIRNLTIDKPASSSFKAVATGSRLHLAGNAGMSVDIIRLNGSVAKRLTLNGALSNAVRLAAGVYFVHIRDGNGVRILPPYRILLY
jgi:hypothetical protein